MKRLWTVMSVMAMANLLVIVAAFGWLVTSDRIDAGRVAKIRAVLTEPVAIETARLEAEAKAEEERRKAEETAAKLQREPVTASDLLNLRIETAEVDQQRLERLRREVRDLQAFLAREREALEKDRAAFAAEVLAAAQENQRLIDLRGSEQFKKALATYQSLRPADAAATMRGLMATPVAADQPDGTTLVVAYLDAMDERTRSRIVSEFIKSDAALAADLLERLRNLGVPSRTAEAGNERGSG